MCCAIFGVGACNAGRTSTAVAWRDPGVAMRLTNILRDVGEDAARGRCYLPTMDLARPRSSGDSGAVAASGRHGECSFSGARARDLYRQALPGIPLLQPMRRDAPWPVRGDSKILEAIESDFDTLSHRVSASRMTLPGVAWRSWRGLPRRGRPLSPRRGSSGTSVNGSVRASWFLFAAHAGLILFSTAAMLTVLAGSPGLDLTSEPAATIMRVSFRFAGPTYVVLGALSAVAFLQGTTGRLSALLLAPIASALALGAELVGTSTGLPFGD
jgi:hypothetical protein